MGITIHYRFMVTSKEVVLRLLKDAKRIAGLTGMKILQDEVMSLVLNPHPKCESIHLEFCKWKEVKAREGWDYCKETMQDYEKVLADDDCVCSGFTKTQYAGLKTHVLVAEFLRKVAGFCTLAYVSDEADYYETRDMELAARSFDESTAILRSVAEKLKEMYGEENVYCAIDNAEGGH